MIEEIREFVNWVRRRAPDAYTWHSYRYALAQFLTHVGDCPPEAVTSADIGDFVNAQVARGLRPPTINRYLRTISAMYNWLADEQPGLVNPVRPRRHFLRKERRLPRAVPAADVERLFAVVDSVRDRAIFLIMLRCGLRVGEVAALTLRCLYLREERPRMQVWGKGSKERAAYLSSQALAGLRAYLKERPRVDCDAVFLNYKDEPLSVRGIQKRLQGYCQQAGVHFTCHQLRHRFANDLVSVDVPVTTVQYLLGHAWISSTQTYLAANDPKVRADFFAALARLPEWEA